MKAAPSIPCLLACVALLTAVPVACAALPALRLPPGAVEYPLPRLARLGDATLAMRAFHLPMAPDAAAGLLAEQIDGALHVLPHGGGIALMPAGEPDGWLLMLSPRGGGTDGVLSRLGMTSPASADTEGNWLPAGTRRRLAYGADEAGANATQEIHVNPAYPLADMALAVTRGLSGAGWRRVGGHGAVSHWRLGARERMVIVVGLPVGSAVLAHTVARSMPEPRR